MSATPLTIGLTPTEQAARVAAIVLNKVKNLEWYYFERDLRSELTLDPDARPPNLALLRRIEDRGFGDRNTRYRWIGTEEEKKGLLDCVLAVMATNRDTSRQIFQRIFDMDEIVPSYANRGVLRLLNSAIHWWRRKKYQKTVRTTSYRGRITILAEGDSWFQFPLPIVVKDIVDQLIKDSRYCVFTLAAGGDWLSSMLEAHEYLPELSRAKPKIFLFSGGGNDLTSDGRIGYILRHQKAHVDPPSQSLSRALRRLFNLRQGNMTPEEQKVYEEGLECFSEDFFGLANLMFLEYLLLLLSLSQRKLSHTFLITHGYDYMIPTRKSTARWWSFRRYVNWVEDSGQWLWTPMEEKHLSEEQKRHVVFAIITELNEILIDAVKTIDAGENRFFHVDCRGIAGEHDWYDEIHLKTAAFRRVKDLFALCIEHVRDRAEGDRNLHEKKVFRRADLDGVSSPDLRTVVESERPTRAGGSCP